MWLCRTQPVTLRAHCSHGFLVQAEGEDSLKKMQLMELAILNGTYRDANIKSRKKETGVRLTAASAVCPHTFLLSVAQHVDS